MTAIEAQKAMFYAGSKRLTDGVSTLLESGITKEELRKNIERNPSLWGKYLPMLELLPSSELGLIDDGSS